MSTPTPDSKRQLLAHGTAFLVMLTIQFIIGRTITLVTKFQPFTDQTSSWAWAWQQPVLVIHIVLGILLVVSSVSLLVRSAAHKSQAWMIAAAVGAVATIVSFAFGAAFVSTQNRAYTYVMALFFTVAFWSIVARLLHLVVRYG